MNSIVKSIEGIREKNMKNNDLYEFKEFKREFQP